jgi:uncharacterized protein (TIGR02596 family)
MFVRIVPSRIPPCDRARRRGFSLVELLVVLAIIAIVSALAVPAIGSALRSYKLDTTGQVVVNQLNLARQTALSRGHAVQVRFYQLPDYNAVTTGAPSVYRGMQTFVEGDPIQGTPVTVATTAMIKPILFPAPVVISTATGTGPVSPLLPATPNSADPLNPLPVYQANYKYAVFHFKPDGSTDISGTGNVNSITLVIENDKIATGGLPANFETIAIDPLNGAVRSFRP